MATAPTGKPKLEVLKRLWSRRQRVFISSTSQDLQGYREAVEQIVKAEGMDVLTMDTFPAMATSASRGSAEMVSRCDVFIGLYARRYGTTDGDGVSVTAREYDEAVARGIPRLCFVLADDAEWPAAFAEGEPAASKVRALRQKIMRDTIVKPFHSLSALRDHVQNALDEYLGKVARRARRRAHVVLAVLSMLVGGLIAWGIWTRTDAYQIHKLVGTFESDADFRTLLMDAQPGVWLSSVVRVSDTADAIGAAESLVDTGTRAMALLALVPALCEKRGASVAGDIVRRVEAMARDIDSPDVGWKVYMALARRYRDSGSPAKALEAVKEAQSRAAALEYAEGRATAFVEVGTLLSQLGDVGAARMAGRKAQEEARTIRDDGLQARALADTVPLVGLPAEGHVAGSSSTAAEVAVAAIADPIERSAVLVHISRALFRAGQGDSARRATDEALRAIEKMRGRSVQDFARLSALEQLLAERDNGSEEEVAAAERFVDAIVGMGLRAQAFARVAVHGHDATLRARRTGVAFDALEALRGDESEVVAVATSVAGIFASAGYASETERAAEPAYQLVLKNPTGTSHIRVFWELAQAMAQVGRSRQVDDLVELGLEQARLWPDSVDRSELYSRIAGIVANRGDLRRAARLVLMSTVPLHRFEGIGRILAARAVAQTAVPGLNVSCT